MTESYKGYSIVIEQDDCAMNPREDFDNLGKLALFHGRYSVKNDTTLSPQDYKNWGDFKAAIEKEYGTSVILSVYMYDHSGVAINTTGFSCPWDSGQLGFTFVSHASIREEYSLKRVSPKAKEKARKILIDELETYGSYLNGDVYSYTVKDENGEEFNSCCGFFGDDHEKSGLMESAKNAIDCMKEEMTA
jgi:hypothetical protein